MNVAINATLLSNNSLPRRYVQMKNLANIFKAKKLIKISMSYDDKKNVIGSIKITGDFFIHPEETIETLESNLADTKLERNEISKKSGRKFERL